MLVIATVLWRLAFNVVVCTPGAPAGVHAELRRTDRLQEPWPLLRVAEPLLPSVTVALQDPSA